MAAISLEAKATLVSTALKACPFPLTKGMNVSFYFEYLSKLSRATITPYRDSGINLNLMFDGGRAHVHARYIFEKNTLVFVHEDSSSPTNQRRAVDALNFADVELPEGISIPQLRAA